MKRLQNWILGLVLLLGAVVLARPQSGAGGAQTGVSGGAGVSQTIFCGATVACAGTTQSGVKIAYGTAPLTSGTPSTATLTALPFTSSSSYSCSAEETTTATNNLLKVANASGSSTVITGPNTVTDVIAYVCVGT
jgi:hypothetical protein